MRRAVLGLGVAGVDLIRSRRGPLVLEVNSSPGLEGIEQATGVDIAGRIVDFVAAAGQPARRQTAPRRLIRRDRLFNAKLTSHLTAA